VRNYILKHGGSEEDSRDIFQDGIMVVYEQRKNRGLVLTSDFGTYLYAICRNIWLKQIRDKQKIVYNEMEALRHEIEKKDLKNHFSEIDEISLKESRMRVYQKYFKKMSEECKKLLKMMAEGLSVKQIQFNFNYKSEGFAYKKRSICRSRLIKMIKQDKNYLKNEEY
jgi:RNA polymerase sigma factor (sigma-70 family)